MQMKIDEDYKRLEVIAVHFGNLSDSLWCYPIVRQFSMPAEVSTAGH